MPPSPTDTALSRLPQPAQWALLILASAIASVVLQSLHTPAAQFLGPMLTAIAFGVSGATVRLPKPLFKSGQAMVGCLVAHAITYSVLLEVAQSWHVMLIGTLLTVVLSVLVGGILVRYGSLPGTTAAWGTSPGAAAAMVAMAEEYGADSRIVATMQYVRVVCVVVMGAIISRLLGSPGSGTESHSILQDWTATSTWIGFICTLGIAWCGLRFGDRFPAGALLIPIVLGTVLQLTGWFEITLPHWLLSLAYGAMGCYVGLRFDRPTLKYVIRAMPAMLGASMLLIALCALSALWVAWSLDKDYLSAYLATSPGGLDSLAIIAIDTHADVGLVLAMQALRLFGVILSGPYLAKQIARLAR